MVSLSMAIPFLLDDNLQSFAADWAGVFAAQLGRLARSEPGVVLTARTGPKEPLALALWDPFRVAYQRNMTIPHG